MSNFNGTSYFNRDDPKYRCCCSSMHIETGAVVLACFQAFSVLSSFSVLLVHPSLGHGSSFATNLFLTACFVLAIKTKNKYYLIPHMITVIISIIICAFILLVPLGFVFAPNAGDAIWVILLIVFLGIIILLVGIWDFMVVRQYYNYLDDMELHLRTNVGYNNA